MKDLFIEEKQPIPTSKKVVAAYDYQDTAGQLVYQVVKYQPKDFRQRRPDGKGGWIWDMKGIDHIPYHLPELLAAIEAGQVVYIVEGERDVHSMEKIELTATTNHGGSGKWKECHSKYFPAGVNIVILPDNDEPGRCHAKKVSDSLTARGCNVKIIELPGLPDKGDISDWIAAGHGKDDLMKLIENSNIDSWKNPISFSEHELPPFRYDIFPDWLSSYIKSEAEATQTPPDLAGMLSMSVCAAAVAKKAVVQIRPGWVEPLNLFTVTALPPASRKSAVFANITEPVLEYEERLTAESIPYHEDQVTQRKILESTVIKVQGEAAKATGIKRDEKINEAQALARELAESKVKALPRLIADDCSPEKLSNLMSEQGGRLAVFAAEGDTFDIMGGRYSSGTPNLGVYLRGHAGDTIRIDRIGRAPEFIVSPALTLGMAVQPEVLRGLIGKPSFRGRGLLGRFLYAMPVANIGRRRVKTEPVPPEVRMVYKQNIKKLFGIQCNAEPHILKMSGQAEVMLDDFEVWLEPQLGEFGTLGSIQDWAGKLAGAVARIAGILHMAENVDNPQPWDIPISGEIMAGVILLSEYLIAHAWAAFDEMGGNPDIDAARTVLKWIEKNGQALFTKRELHNKLQGTFKRADDLDTPLSVLVERGYIKEIVQERAGAGRKPSNNYEVNPCVLREN